MAITISGNGVIDADNFDVDASGNITSPTTTTLNSSVSSIQNVVKTDRIAIPSSASAPSNPVNGEMYFDTGSNSLYIVKDSAWKLVNEPPAPNSITGQTLWIDMSNQSTVSGSNVADLSGFGRNATIIDASSGNSNTPTLNSSHYGTTTSPNTGYVSAFDSGGALHHTQGELPNYSGTPYTFWMLHTSEFAAGHDSWINIEQGWGSNYVIIRTNSNLVDWNFYNLSGGNASQASANGTTKSATGQSWQIYMFIFNGSSCTVVKRIGGVEYVQTGVSTPGSGWDWSVGPAVVGNSPWASSTESLQGKIAAYGMYTGELNAYSRSVIYDYYNAKGFSI